MVKDKATVEQLIKGMPASLDVIYPQGPIGVPPIGYTNNVVSALLSNDPRRLMDTLDTLDIDPWQVSFADDGLAINSPKKFGMITLAERNQSWDCVTELVLHFQLCRQGTAIMQAMQPMLFEYEAATDPARVAHLESCFRAANAGYVLNLMEHGNIDIVFHPNFAIGYPKATRFVFQDFAKVKFEGKHLGPVMNKRLALRQRALSAISAGDGAAFAMALDYMKANAMAGQAAKRVVHEALSGSEIETFILVAMTCDYPEFVETLLSKALEFKKAQSLVKAAGKKIDAEQFKLLKDEDDANLLDTIFYFAKVIDFQLSGANMKPPQSLDKAIENAMFMALHRAGDGSYIEQVKSKSEEVLSVMQDCVGQACSRAQSTAEKQEIEASIPANDQAVDVPRERARL